MFQAGRSGGGDSDLLHSGPGNAWRALCRGMRGGGSSIAPYAGNSVCNCVSNGKTYSPIFVLTSTLCQYGCTQMMRNGNSNPTVSKAPFFSASAERSREKQNEPSAPRNLIS